MKIPSMTKIEPKGLPNLYKLIVSLLSLYEFTEWSLLKWLFEIGELSEVEYWDEFWDGFWDDGVFSCNLNNWVIPIPIVMKDNEVLNQAKNVLSFAIWSLATEPLFSSLIDLKSVNDSECMGNSNCELVIGLVVVFVILLLSFVVVFWVLVALCDVFDLFNRGVDAESIGMVTNLNYVVA